MRWLKRNPCSRRWRGKSSGSTPWVWAVPVLGEAPEALDAVDVVLATLEGDLVIHGKVFAVALEVVVAAELVGVMDRALDRVVPDLGHQRLLGAVGHDHAVDLAAPLQQTENTDFSGRAPAALAFAPPAEAAFVGIAASISPQGASGRHGGRSIPARRP